MISPNWKWFLVSSTIVLLVGPSAYRSEAQVDESLQQGLALTPRAFRSAAKKIQPCLVTIESFGGVSTVAGRIGGIRNQGEGNTTGIMISPDGYIITSSFNFIERPPVITVITSDNVRRVAKLLGRDDTRNICLLKIDNVNDMPVPEMISENEVRVGQWAISIGVGYGDKNPAISMGIISAKNRIAGRAIQTDANISPANYGGPLIDIEGRLIGVCVPLAPGNQGLAGGVQWYDSGIGFAIPVSNPHELIERLKDGKHIKRAYLGIESENATEGSGVLIKTVVKGTAADSAKLRTGDRITEFAGVRTPNLAELRLVLAKHTEGDEVVIKYDRDSQSNSVTVKLGAPPKPGDQDTPSLIPGKRRDPRR